jgi:GNAT superfamily N-acetyltransferase
LEGFACSTLDTPWSVGIEQMVCDHLPDALENPGAPGALPIKALGLWVGERLVAVDAWKPERDPVVCATFPGEVVWLNVVLATHVDFWHQGFGRHLKETVIQEARKRGVVAITSVVSWENTAMGSLNQKLGGVETEIITDVEPDPDLCRCILPIGLPDQGFSRPSN